MPRRMFSPNIIDSDAFLDMSPSAQNLYFHLGMRADDDGFVGNPKKIMRISNTAEDDFKILLAKRFILIFESGVIVIKHWRINNLIRKDWYKETIYKEEKERLLVKDNGAYTEKFSLVNENVTIRSRRLGKVRLGNNREIQSLSKTSKNDLVACSNEELVEISKLLDVPLNYVEEKHQIVMDNILSGDIKKYKVKTTYYTLRKWIRADIQKGFIKRVSDTGYTTVTKEFLEKRKGMAV